MRYGCCECRFSHVGHVDLRVPVLLSVHQYDQRQQSLRPWIDSAVSPGDPFENYVQVFKISGIMQATLISLARTVLGTACSVAASAFLGYLLSKQNMLGHKIVYRFIIITMYFNAGIIPWYMNMMNLHLLNNFWVYIIPYIVVPYNIILIKTYMEGISPSLEDAAQIDGAGYMVRFSRIVLPVCTPILATTAIFRQSANGIPFRIRCFWCPSRNYIRCSFCSIAI